MARQKFRIVVEFDFGGHTPGGVLDTVVNSRKAVDVQLDANYKWLDAKGHSPTSETVTPVSN